MKKLILFGLMIGMTVISKGDSWTRKASLPDSGRYAAVGFSIGNKGYIGTGETRYSINNYAFKDFWEFDPSLNTWTQKADFAGAGRHDAFGFSIGTKGYIGAGRDSIGNYLQDFWEYDPSLNIWTSKANFGGVSRELTSYFVIDTIAYVGLGRDFTSIYLNGFMGI